MRGSFYLRLALPLLVYFFDFETPDFNFTLSTPEPDLNLLLLLKYFLFGSEDLLALF
jgi:hypothetical protein